MCGTDSTAPPRCCWSDDASRAGSGDRSGYGLSTVSVYGSEYLGDEPMEMPPSILMTEAIWFTFEPSYLFAAGVAEPDAPGTLHAAEHAAIGLLPLIATCDRWDLGGLSTLYHADTERPTIFVYDAAPGRSRLTSAVEAVRTWLGATLGCY